MKLGVSFTPKGWDDFKSWENDRAMRRRIDRLIEELRRNPDRPGIGKAERLSAWLSGWSSLRIDDEHRLVYRVRDDDVQIMQCRGHYDH